MAYLTFLFLALPVHAQKNSYHLANPIGWMYQLPVGEQPGWATPFWFMLEINQASIWNKEFSMTDSRNGDIYTYGADFEQSSAIINVGGAITERIGVSLEVPYANRNGGFLDDFIDQFHTLIGSNRFLRNVSHKFGNTLKIQKNGVDLIASQHGEGVASLKPKIKFWLWKEQSATSGACDCGFSLGLQAKFPTRYRDSGMSNGSADYTAIAHLGFPLAEESGIWFTGAVTKLGENETFEGWPMRKWSQMYEISMDLGISSGFGIVLQARTESPFMEKQYLTFNYTASTPEYKRVERVASGWNNFVHWRGSQSFGPRWRWKGGSEANLLIIEDWGIGRYDSTGDWTYVNNAPDVAFASQINIVF